MASVLILPPRSANSMRPRCVTPRLAPFPDHFRLHVLRGDPDGVVGLVAHLQVRLAAAAHIGADAAEPQEIDRRLQDRRHEFVRRHRPASTPRRLCASAESLMDFSLAAVDAAACGKL